MKRTDFRIVCLRDRAHTHTLSHIIRVIFVTFVFIWRALMRKATNKYDAKRRRSKKSLHKNDVMRMPVCALHVCLSYPHDLLFISFRRLT